MELQQNNKIYFNEGYHQYVDDDFNTYDGITAIIKKCICPDLYGDVDEETLKKAALHGTLCHKLCEAFDNAELDLQDDNRYYAKNDITLYDEANCKVLIEAGQQIPDEELYKYVELIAQHDMFIEASEYLVSDNKNFASQIDKVVREGDKEFSILDLKFTYTYHEEPVTWQTSFYADMFEAQNPGAKVKNLYCIHIHKYKDGSIKADLHKLKRIKSDILEECKRCYLTDTPFDNPLSKKEIKMDNITLSLEGELWDAESIAELINVKKQIDDKYKKMTTAVKQWFIDNPKYNKVKTPQVNLSQSSTTTAFCFDEARLKEEQPEIYKMYCTGLKTTAARTTISLTKK